MDETLDIDTPVQNISEAQAAEAAIQAGMKRLRRALRELENGDINLAEAAVRDGIAKLKAHFGS